MSIPPVVVGAAVGVVADHIYDKFEDDITGTGDSHGQIPPHYRMMMELLSRIEANTRSSHREDQPEVVQRIILDPVNPIDYNDRQYDHCWAFTPLAQKIYVSVQGTTPTLFTTAVGWNKFDIPNKCQLTGDPAGGHQQVVTLFFSNVSCNMPGL